MKKEYVFDSFRVIRHQPAENGDLHLFSENQAGEALRFHRSLPFFAIIEERPHDSIPLVV